MRITVKTTGVDQARKFLKFQIQTLEGQRGQFYPHQSARIKAAIEGNADQSYNQSPAKETAKQSADKWIHERHKRHRCKIMAPLFANYRQYGCGGIKIAELVRFTATDIKDMLQQAREDLQPSRI